MPNSAALSIFGLPLPEFRTARLNHSINTAIIIVILDTGFRFLCRGGLHHTVRACLPSTFYVTPDSSSASQIGCGIQLVQSFSPVCHLKSTLLMVDMPDLPVLPAPPRHLEPQPATLEN